YKRFKYEFKNEYFVSAILHMNKITLITLDNEENDKQLESVLGIKGTSVILTGSKLYNISYDPTDKTLRRAILLKTQEVLKEFIENYKNLPDAIVDEVFNKYEEINGQLDIALILHSN
ncbi:MAG: hypothetical protein K6D97_08705, partial [Clostridia bacterium]|nr:hypothetical protein [Clostridia bacterium]